MFYIITWRLFGWDRLSYGVPLEIRVIIKKSDSFEKKENDEISDDRYF